MAEDSSPTPTAQGDLDVAGVRVREAEVRLIIEGVKDHAIAMLDAGGHIQTWNAAAERIMGYALAEVKGRHFRLSFTEDDRSAGVPERDLAIARTDGKFLGEVSHVRKDGTRFFASVSISPLHDDDGSLRGYVKVTHDMTDEARLRARITRLHRFTAALAEAATTADMTRVLVEDGVPVVDAANAALWLTDRSGMLRLAAHRGVPDDFIKTWALIAVDADIPAARVARTGEPLWVQTPAELEAVSTDVAARARDASRGNAFAAVPLIVRERVLGVLVYGYLGEHAFTPEDKALLETMARDCAQSLDRARLLDAEVRSNERLRLLADVGAMLATTLDYETTLSNLARSLVPRFADWCAVDLVESEGEPKSVAIAHADPEKVALAYELRRKNPPRPGEPGLMWVLSTGKAQLYPVVSEALLASSKASESALAVTRELGVRSAMIVPLAARGRTIGALTLVSTDGDRCYGDEDLQLAREIATRAALAVDNARLYRESREAVRLANDASRLKDEFLATVSHELRTPLNALLGWARMLRTGALSHAKRDTALESIERNAVAQTQLVEDLLDISRIITGKLTLEVRPIDLARVVEAALESVRPATEAKQIRLVSNLGGSPHTIMGDGARLQQVVWNLFSNAIKFTPTGGSIEVSIRRTESVELAVVDSGQGIAPEFLPFVFDRFRQADSGHSRSHGGLGLGLAICRNLIELHGGTIEASSDGPSRGTTLRVRLPPAPVRFAPMDTTRAQQPTPDEMLFERPEELKGLKVLVVEDDKDARELIVTILTSCAAETRAVASMNEALETLRTWRPDVLLSDIGMPGGDGYDLIRAVRALPLEAGGDTPAAALTAYARTEDRRRALLAGYQMHAPKPVEPDELVSTIANLARIGRVMR